VQVETANLSYNSNGFLIFE